MDKVGRVLLLFWQLYCGNSINKEAFCFEMDIDRRTFDRDIAAVRNFWQKAIREEKLFSSQKESSII